MTESPRVGLKRMIERGILPVVKENAYDQRNLFRGTVLRPAAAGAAAPAGGYLRGICKIFRRFFAQKKRFLIGFIYKFLLLSGIVDGCNGIRFPLFALSYF